MTVARIPVGSRWRSKHYVREVTIVNLASNNRVRFYDEHVGTLITYVASVSQFLEDYEPNDIGSPDPRSTPIKQTGGVD